LCGKKSRKGILIFKEKVAVPKESQPTTTTTNLGVNSGERQLQLAELIFECLHLKQTYGHVLCAPKSSVLVMDLPDIKKLTLKVVITAVIPTVYLFTLDSTAHMQRHEGNKDLRCDMCEKSFFTKNALFRHRRFHTGEKPFQCDICGKKFADCSNRKRHRQQHHKLALPEVPGSETVLATTAEGGSVQVVLMETPEEMASAAEEDEGKTFTSLQTFLMEDFLRVELVTFDEDAAGDRITLVRSASELVGQDEECLSVGLQPVEVTLHPEDLASSLPHIDPCPEDAPFNLDTIPSDPVDISTTLDTPVDLSPSLHSMAGSPLHITPPSLRNSPSNLSPTLETNPLDLSPSLQPMGGSPLHMPSSDFLLTLHGY
ncbi:hypothetical protein B566_EDAN015181, partial [Ephemera danica]